MSWAIIMTTGLRHAWSVATSGYLLVPACMTGAAVGLSVATGFIDRAVPPGAAGGWLYSGEADAARDLLSTIAGSIMTVTGVVFSITVVALTQASSQFGPRLLRNFMQDRSSQFSLGTFVATFVYCLLVLRTVRGEGNDRFVPHVGATVSVLLAGASVAVLVYFINHLATSLQPSTVIAGVSRDLVRSLEGIQRDSNEAGGSPSDAADYAVDESQSVAIQACRDGYIQAIDYRALVEEASERNLLIRLGRRPGDHVIEGNLLMRACNLVNRTPELEHKLESAVIIGRHPASGQDVEQAIRQLVEIAVRALSPGINDPFTAINCVDALGAGICRISRDGLPPGVYCDPRGTVRVVARHLTFRGLIDASFLQIRQYGACSPSVMIRMLEVIEEAAFQIEDEPGRMALLRHAAMICQDARRATRQEQDRSDIQERYDSAVAVLRPEL